MTTQEHTAGNEVDIVEASRTNLWKDAVARLVANKLAVIGIIPIVLLFFIAVFGPFLTPYDFLAQDFTARLAAPSSEHWLGTDELGRDVLSRILYGARTAVSVGLVSTAISLIVGLVMGSLAGYLGGRVDFMVVWLTDVTRSMPALLLAIVINLTLKTPLEAWMEEMYLATKNGFFRQTMWVDLVLVFGALALIQWPGYARLIRGQILSIRSRNYVLAARALGMPTGRILTRYVIPNAMGPLIVAVSAGLGGAMVLESAFSFLGVGVQLPIPSWGKMISDGLRMYRTHPHLLAGPAVMMAIITVSFAWLGDGLNDALNPRQWGG
ncbi:MAG: ABC transporter permease [Caldilineaceae bacterium]|nr:ABC transporter permease [Caldilineaceae bacterium]